jgi:disulfide bond formation protein DsbB
MLLAGAGSLALLLGAFAFQAAGYAPCKLCVWQRWPHGLAVASAAAILALGPVLWLGLLGWLGAFTSGAIGVYHTGVEREWWEGPASCSGGGLDMTGLSGGDLLSLDAPLGVIQCDEVAWAFAGLSMASWNAIISFALAALWVRALATDRHA